MSSAIEATTKVKKVTARSQQPPQIPCGTLKQAIARFEADYPDWQVRFSDRLHTLRSYLSIDAAGRQRCLMTSLGYTWSTSVAEQGEPNPETILKMLKLLESRAMPCSAIRRSLGMNPGRAKELVAYCLNHGLIKTTPHFRRTVVSYAVGDRLAVEQFYSQVKDGQ